MAGAAQQQDGDPITDINVTPLVDVSLVLVIIFMAIAPFAMQSGIKVLESKAKAAVGKVSASENVSLRLSKEGVVTLNGKEVARESLGAVLAEALAASKDRMVTLSADDENFVGDVVSLLDAAKQAGAQKIAIMTTEKPAAGSAPPAEAPAEGEDG
ncbi:MAG: biopolymer transport protein ExbD [Elusimicrobia bacterium]|nr:MAG: biopolymer transport protein ExbD [Elusimicrobiota bacterium]